MRLFSLFMLLLFVEPFHDQNAASSASEENRCEYSVISLFPNLMKAGSSGWIFEFKATILVGKGAAVKPTTSELDKLRFELLTDHRLLLLALGQVNTEQRRLIVQYLNGAIGRPVVYDIYFDELSRTEYAPIIPR